MFLYEPFHDSSPFFVVVSLESHRPFEALAGATDCACALAVLKRAACGTGVVVPLFRVAVADAAHMTVVVGERNVARWAPQSRRRLGRRARRETGMGFYARCPVVFRTRVR